jgi:hypothetical protein
VLLLSTGGSGACDCTDVGCFSGLQVRVEPVPTIPYRVEAYSGGGDFSRYVWQCTAANGCGGTAYFEDFFPSRVFVEVITARDTVRREIIGPIGYGEQFPNGRHCGAACRNGMVTVTR